MASLENQKPKDSFTGLLKTTDDASVGASKKDIVDGQQSQTGLGLSSTKVFANTLQIENAPSSSSNTTVATLNASGDVETRTLASKAFDSTISDVIFAKSDGAESSPLVYSASGDDTADSLVVGSIFTLNSADVVVTGSIGDKLELTFNGMVEYEETDAKVNFVITQNGVDVVTSNFGNSIATLNSMESVTMHLSTTLITTADNFDVQYSSVSGVTNIEVGTYLKIQKFS